MVKYTTSLFVAALVAAPALAQSNWDEFDAREYDDLFTRHPDEAGLTAREPSYASNDIYERAYDAESTFEGRSYDGEDNLEARELDDLYERALEQLEARSMPSFFNFMRDGMRQVKKIAHEKPKTPTTKDATTPPASPTTPATPDSAAPAAEAEGAPAGGADDNAAPDAREFEENAMWERELDNMLQERDYSDDAAMYERSFDDVDYLQERDFNDDASMYERDIYADELQEREFADEDLLEREFYDEDILQEREFDDELQEREVDEEMFARADAMYELLAERDYFDDLD